MIRQFGHQMTDCWIEGSIDFKFGYRRNWLNSLYFGLWPDKTCMHTCTYYKEKHINKIRWFEHVERSEDDGMKRCTV